MKRASPPTTHPQRRHLAGLGYTGAVPADLRTAQAVIAQLRHEQGLKPKQLSEPDELTIYRHQVKPAVEADHVTPGRRIIWHDEGCPRLTAAHACTCRPAIVTGAGVGLLYAYGATSPAEEEARRQKYRTYNRHYAARRKTDQGTPA
jgi:hypothetical protein